MDENSAALDEWEDVELDEVEDEASEAAESPQNDSESSDVSQPSETEKSPQEASESPTEASKPDAEGADQYLLKHLGEEKRVGRDEVVTLAQKGLDYDRVRTKLDTQTEELTRLQADADRLRADAEQWAGDSKLFGELQELAREGGYKGLSELIDETRASLLMQREGLDAGSARRRVALDRRERELSEREAAGAKPKQAEPPREEPDRAGLREFVQSFPDVKPQDIPKEVWAAISEGRTLTDAYTQWQTRSEIETLKSENKRLSEQLAAEKKSAENRRKTTGSRQGVTGTLDEDIDRYWNED